VLIQKQSLQLLAAATWMVRHAADVSTNNMAYNYAAM
jgi:hypothetical protein